MGKEIVPKGSEGFFGELGSGIELSKDQKAELAAFEKEGMGDDIKGLPVDYPRIEILHAGAAQFKFTNEELVVPNLNVVVCHIESQRVWWPYKFGQGPKDADGQPHCFSRDLVHPEPTGQEIQAETCGTCAQNQWGSDTKTDGSQGRGKACKEIRRLFVIPEGRMIPHWIAVTPANLKPMSRYLMSIRDQQIKRVQHVVTKLSLRNKDNKDGVSYSELVLEKGDRIPDTTIYMVMELRKKIVEMITKSAPLSEVEVNEKSK